jgi:hypothetical protein
MSIRSMMVWGLLASLALLSAGVCQETKTTRSDRNADVFSGKAVFVTIAKNSDRNVGLQDPEIRTLGDRSFLVGRDPDASSIKKWIWVPLSEVREIEEFVDVKAMAAVYRIGAADAK